MARKATYSETVKSVQPTILKLNSFEELQAVSDLVRRRWQELRQRATHRWSPGDLVEFTAKDGGVVQGKILKVNRVNVVLKSTSGGRFPGTEWTVGASLLRPQS